MKLRHRRLISIITSFIMAVTVFGCTSLTFAANENDELQATDNEPAVTEPEGNGDATPSDEQQAVLREGGDENPSEESGNNGTDEDDEELAAPGNLSAVPGDKKVTLTWGEVSPTIDGTVTYEIFNTNEESADPIATVSELTYEITGLTAGTYTYFIRTVETPDEGEPIKSGIVAFDAVTVIDFASQRLTGLRSDPGYKAVLLEWNPVEGATGYLIYRRQGEERGNVDGNCIDPDGHKLLTLKSSQSKGYYQKFQTGYKLVAHLPGTIAKNATTGKIEFRDGGLQDLNMTYVYFYQYVIVPYYDPDGDSSTDNNIYCKGNNGAKTITNTTLKNSIGTDVNVNTVKNNTVLPMYVLYRVKKNKPYYRTNSMGDGKKMGRLAKGTYYIGYDKKDGRDLFYMKKSGTSKTDWWFAQKNTNVIQGYYLFNGNSQDLNRKDWQTGYSKKTVLDYVNRSGLSSNTRYLIWVSKYAQHTYIFTGSKGNWKLINNGDNFVTTGSKGSWSNLCASGKVMFNSRNINGPINGKQYCAKRGKYYYYCLSKLHKTVRLHSVLYKKKAAFGSGKYYDKTLGIPKSNGCIRHKPGASQFIYNNVPKGTKTLVF